LKILTILKNERFIKGGVLPLRSKYKQRTILQKVVEMFSFKQKVKKSFGYVKEDIAQLKNSVTEWLYFLNRRQDELETRIWLLEEKIKKLEQERKVA